MRVKRPARLLSYAVPLADQAVVAAFNLALQLTLIHLASREDYGTFVLWQAVVMSMVGFQDALVGMPLSLRISYDPESLRRRALERQVAGFAALFLTGATVLLLAAVTLATRSVDALAGAVALFGLTFLAYYATRFLAQGRAKFAVALAMDTAYALSALGAIAALALSDRFALVPLFIVLSGPALLATLIGLVLLERPPPPDPRRAFARYRRIWRDSRWTVAAVAAAELQNRAFIFVITAAYGPAALAGVFAGNLVLRHLNMIALAFTAFARPALLKLRERGAIDAIVRFCALAGAGLLALYVVNLAVVSVVWPLIETYIYADRYPNMFPVVRTWTLVYALQVPVTLLALMLVTFGRYREDSLAVMVGSVVTLSATVVLALAAGPQAALLGMGAGYVVTAAIMAWRVSVELSARRRAAPPS